MRCVMKVTFQDPYNEKKTWTVAFLSHGYYLTQEICGKQYGRGQRVSKAWLNELGIFDMKRIAVRG